MPFLLQDCGKFKVCPRLHVPLSLHRTLSSDPSRLRHRDDTNRSEPANVSSEMSTVNRTRHDIIQGF